MLSVRDIQGQWCEKATQKQWSVDGILVERAKGTGLKGQSKPIVLSDGPNGVEWGNGNLTGSIDENGCLGWRNRRGDIAYRWEKMTGSTKAAPTQPMTAATETVYPILPIWPMTSQTNKRDSIPTRKSSKETSKEDSPRSTNSGTSNETAAMTAGMASLNLDASSTEFPFVDDIAFEEVKMLLEMARNRLMVGDVYTSMRYITLAQQVQPGALLVDGVQ